MIETRLFRNQMLKPRQNVPVKPSDWLVQSCVRIASVVALAGYVMALATLLMPAQFAGKADWAEPMLLLAATVATLASLSRQLPAQNVMLAASGIAIVGGIAHGVSAATSVPFGPLLFTEEAGPQLFNKLPWPVPFIWVVVVLNSRGVARLILRPWRKLRTYGFWLIGFTVMLTVVFDAALEPFAFHVKRYWLWEQTKISVTWHGVPLTNFAAWIAVSLLILGFVTPALINKKPSVTKSVPDYHPLVGWLSLDALFAVGAATEQLWTAAAFCVLSGILVAFAAIRGGKW